MPRRELGRPIVGLTGDGSPPDSPVSTTDGLIHFDSGADEMARSAFDRRLISQSIALGEVVAGVGDAYTRRTGASS